MVKGTTSGSIFSDCVGCRLWVLKKLVLVVAAEALYLVPLVRLDTEKALLWVSFS